MRSTGLLGVVSLLVVLVGCGSGGGIEPLDSGEVDASTPDTSSGDSASDSSRPTNTNPVLLGVRPDHGPFTGGSSVTLRGSNFTEGLTVRFGTAQVQPRYLRLMDRNRLIVDQTPAGAPGDVDVTIEAGSYRSRLANSYHYDAFYADPSDGSIAGGTRITLKGQGTNWTAASTVTIDAQPCENVRFVSPSELQCTVPAHAQGAVPITVATGTDSITVREAFTYRETGDPNFGGFSGGSVRGVINVSVLNQLTGDAVPGAVVYLGEQPMPPPAAGLTNMRGQVSLSSPDLRGPVTITATAKCFASSTFVSIDGRDATIFLIPWLNRVPGVDCGDGTPPSGPPRPPIYAATIEGELVFAGPMEFGPNPWDITVPRPRANERRVAYVMTTVSSIFSGNPDPGMGGTVIEEVPLDYGGRGYPYTIVARPSALAVYAIAGLERTDTMPRRFTPYVMGVARNVLGAPRALVSGVDIDMNIPLDHELNVRMRNLPPQENSRPNQFQVETWIDLGGEGVIPRPDIELNGRSPNDPYRIVALPAFLGTLADARLIVRTTYGSGATLDEPSSTVVSGGIESPDGELVVDNWVGIPRILEPEDGGSLPMTRRLRIRQDGADPDMFWTVLSQAGSSCRSGFFLGDVVWWQHHFSGSTREIVMPDLSIIPTITDIPRGIYQLSICGFRTAGFDYNNFRYQFLSTQYWTAYSSNTATLTR